MPTVGQPVPGYYYDQFTDTLRPITGGPGPKGDPGNANVTVSPNAPAVAGKAGDLWVQTTTTPWTAPASMPWGIIAYKSGGPGIALTTTPVEIYRLSNVPLQTGRLYRFHIGLRCITVAQAGGTYVGFHTPSSAVIAGTTLVMDAIWAGNNNYQFFYYTTPFTVSSTAAYTIPIQAETAAGTGQVYNGGSSHISVEDIGPNRGQQ